MLRIRVNVRVRITVPHTPLEGIGETNLLTKKRGMREIGTRMQGTRFRKFYQ